MRRIVVGVLVPVLLVGACGRPVGVDGDLTNGWPRLAPATQFVPVVGQCHVYPASTPVVQVHGAASVEPCRSRHPVREVTFVGQFSGVDAQQVVPPAAGSAARRAAYEQCQASVDGYLGGDWHGALVQFTLVVPTLESWRSGSRTFHCDLGRKLTMFDEAVRPGVPSVKDGLRGGRPVALSCAVQDERYDTVEITVDIGCDRGHNAELAGLYTAPDLAWPGDPAPLVALAEAGCRQVVARFLGFPDGRSWPNKEIDMWWADVDGKAFQEDRWRLGDRTVLCFASPRDLARRIVGSLNGIRTGKLQDA